VGALVAAAALVGTASSTEHRPPRSVPLALGSYCRHTFGDGATAYRPHNLDGWSCSVWTQGVWGLEPVDLNAACRWQRGDENARLGPVPGPERALPCTL
jgi:hypothetical protein